MAGLCCRSGTVINSVSVCEMITSILVDFFKNDMNVELETRDPYYGLIIVCSLSPECGIIPLIVSKQLIFYLLQDFILKLKLFTQVREHDTSRALLLKLLIFVTAEDLLACKQISENKNLFVQLVEACESVCSIVLIPLSFSY